MGDRLQLAAQGERGAYAGERDQSDGSDNQLAHGGSPNQPIDVTLTSTELSRGFVASPVIRVTPNF